mmetsp:Transcript_2692/g.9429  ORF Transcript_2692/g.9429 Transcript_2692/m.9429 type:complete len:258 (-) Transcript_2692:3353-4126(-)
MSTSAAGVVTEMPLAPETVRTLSPVAWSVWPPFLSSVTVLEKVATPSTSRLLVVVIAPAIVMAWAAFTVPVLVTVKPPPPTLRGPTTVVVLPDEARLIAFVLAVVPMLMSPVDAVASWRRLIEFAPSAVMITSAAVDVSVTSPVVATSCTLTSPVMSTSLATESMVTPVAPSMSSTADVEKKSPSGSNVNADPAPLVWITSWPELVNVMRSAGTTDPCVVVAHTNSPPMAELLGVPSSTTARKDAASRYAPTPSHAL